VLGDRTNNDEGVIGILEDGTREIVHQGVKEKAREGGETEHLLKDVSDNVEQKRGERVSLPESPSALDPASRDAIEKDRSLAGVVEEADPRAPKFREAFSTHDAVKGVPADGVKGFAEIKLKNRSGGRAPMTGLDNVSCIDKVFSNRAPRDKTSLVGVDKVVDEPPEAEGEALGMDFETAILQGDGAEVFRFVSASLFWEKDDVGLIDGSQVSRKGVEIGECSKQIVLDKVPVLFEESRAKTIWARAGVVVHREEGVSNLF
jgi:hypothetical protein